MNKLQHSIVSAIIQSAKVFVFCFLFFFLTAAYCRTKTNIFILALTWNKSYFASWDTESSVEKLISSAQILSSVLDEK